MTKYTAKNVKITVDGEDISLHSLTQFANLKAMANDDDLQKEWQNTRLQTMFSIPHDDEIDFGAGLNPKLPQKIISYSTPGNTIPPYHQDYIDGLTKQGIEPNPDVKEQWYKPNPQPIMVISSSTITASPTPPKPHAGVWDEISRWSDDRAKYPTGRRDND